MSEKIPLQLDCDICEYNCDFDITCEKLNKVVKMSEKKHRIYWIKSHKGLKNPIEKHGFCQDCGKLFVEDLDDKNE